jgi:hypothetical protein
VICFLISTHGLDVHSVEAMRLNELITYADMFAEFDKTNRDRLDRTGK